MLNVVTGGAGFIGSHLCAYLIECGYSVLCIDNLSTGRFSNVEPLLKNRNFSFLNLDVSEPFNFPAERVYNLASPASPLWYQQDPVGTLTTAVKSMFNCADHARKYGSRILQASTSEIYGTPLEHPQKESYWGNVNPTGPRSCYTEAKRFAETVAVNYQRQFGLDIRIARIFNTFGPNMKTDDGRVISNFIVQALENKEITIFGDGRQTRSFCYIDDLVSGLHTLMESSTRYDPVNLGNDLEISILKLAETVISLTGSSAKLVFHPLPPEDPDKRRPDITLAARSLHWRPQVSLEEGLMRTIEGIEKQMKEPSAQRFAGMN